MEEQKPIYPMKDTVALVPAAGLGTRLGLGPKAFLKLGGVTLLRRVVMVLSECVERILVAVPESYLEQAQREVKEMANIYVGGATHHETFFKLFQLSHEKIVLHHHVARPFASKALIHKIVMAMCKYEAVGSFISPQIPVGCVQGDFVTGSLSRMACFLPQSPHAFSREVLEKAYESATQKGIKTQAPWELVFLTESKIKIIKGEETNIKITTPLDWEIAKKVIAPSLGWI